jgi:putative hydrolase of the HAD superfamily
VKKDILGVAFDLDGTLYPNHRFYIRLVPFLLREHRLLRALGKARDAIRAGAYGEPAPGTFYEFQARIMGEILGEAPPLVQARTEALIYRGWEPLFKKVKPCSHVRETLAALREGGLKLGLLSDFPPETKLVNLGLADYWDAVVSSELTGRLKPSPEPFLELSRRMNLPPERILYVGNNVSYDVIGAKKAGMGAAFFSFPFKKRRFTGNADFVFSSYRQFRSFVLN